MKRLTAIGAVWLTIAATFVGLASAPAHAAAPRDQGWWTVTNPVPPTPDVPGRGLVIQSGADKPTAYAAVLYELDQGTTAGALTLTIAPTSLTTPQTSLMICPLLQPISHPEQGGPIANAPPFDCSRKATASPDSAGKGYKFDAAGLVNDKMLAVAILPNSPAGRVVLSAPGDNSLATTAGASDTPVDFGVPPATDNATIPTPETASAGGFTDTGSPNLGVALPGVADAGPSSVAPPAPAAAPPGANDFSRFVPPAGTQVENATPVLVILLIIGGLAAAGLWFYAGRTSSTTLPIARPSPT